MPNPEKVKAVEELQSLMSGSRAVLLTEFTGLSVQDMSAVRAQLKEAGAEYKVVKNTLSRLAAARVGWDGVENVLVGPTAAAFVHGDPVEAAKVLDRLGRDYRGLKIKGGVLEGSVLEAARAQELARLEAREVQLAKIAGLLQAPMQQMAVVLSALLQNLAYGLQQLLQQKQEQEGQS